MIYKVKVVYCSGWSEISGLEPSLLDLRMWGSFKIFIIRAYVLKEHHCEGGGDAINVNRDAGSIS